VNTPTNSSQDESSQTLEAAIRGAYAAGTPEARESVRGEVEEVIARLDRGALRVANVRNGAWEVHDWVKQAILLYFPLRSMEVIEVGGLEFHDKIPLKKDFAQAGVRVVPHALCRYGAHLERGVVMMPSYVNIGAYVGAGTMVDTWATVGSCAQIGRDVHLSGGVGIGGVLEPLQAAPVIVEDGAFVGSRCVVVEGVRVEKEAVLGAGLVLTASTPIIDVTGPKRVVYRGRVPARSVVIPGTQPRTFPSGEFGVPCGLIIGQRKESTDRKTSLNDVLRDHEVAV
jgi:2,3,4,5-tetrahydropyridine-2-carboxylate N-succinyltransferase